MKRTLLIALSILNCILCTGCEKDDVKAPEAVKTSFNAMFPGATRVEWEKERGLYKAEFRIDLHEKDAWFEKDGTWVRTKTDIALSEVPAVVMQTAKDNQGASWVIEDIDYYEQATGVTAYYRVEYEKSGSDKERSIRIRPDGTLVAE